MPALGAHMHHCMLIYELALVQSVLAVHPAECKLLTIIVHTVFLIYDYSNGLT